MGDSKEAGTTLERGKPAPHDPAHRVLDCLLEGCQLIGSDFRYLYVNDTGARHGRTAKEELLGRTMMEVYPGIEATEMFAILRQCMGERAPRQMENEFIFPDGSKGCFELRFEPVPDGVAILSIDISDRRKTELALRRSTRALTALSRCNQALLRATDERQLMEAVCRIVVEDGGYRMAWIGQRELGGAQSVRRLASAGWDEGCEELSGIWSDAALEAGPAGRAIRTGRPAVTRFIATDPEYETWRLEALARGFASSLGLPLRENSEVFGALTIYAAEPDAFDLAECELLEEMALDLGYGVAALRARVARKRAEARVVHLNAVLRGIRSVNQLITRERDPQTLIRKACELLVESRGFHSSCVVLWDGEHVRASADAGEELKLRFLRRMIVRGELPDCITRALTRPEVVFRHGRATACAGCPVNQDHPVACDSAVVRLESEDKVYGALLVSLPVGVADDNEELQLLREVAGDIAFALQSIEREHRYRSLFNNTSVGIAHCRMLYDGDRPLDFVCLDVNPAFEALTGLKSVTGRRATEIMPGVRESDPQFFAVFGRAARSVAPERFELFVASLGQWFDMSVYSPQPDHFVAVFDVITQRKQTEANLVTFSQRLESLASVVRSLSQARTDDAIRDVVRHAARALVGSDGATFVLRDGDLCHYVDEDAVSPLWKSKKFPMSACISGWVMRNKHPVVIEDIYSDERIPHEAYRPTFVKSLVMVPIHRHSPIGAIGSYWATQYRATPEDVRILQALADSASVAMENVRFLRELEEGEARTRAIYDHLPNATLLWKRKDEGFVLADFNEAAARVSDGCIADSVSRPPRELDRALPNLEEDLATCFERRVAVRREVECAMPGTTEPRRLVLTYGFIPSDLVILHVEDVTEQRRTEEQLKVAQRLEAVGRLAGGVAHDFNNLLLVIMNYAELAARELRESDPVRADIVEIQNAGQRAAALTGQLLAFSRRQVLAPEVLSFNRVVTGIESMLRRLLGEDIEIEVHLAEDLGSVTADPGQIEQVIMNLAVNARDAMPQGGKLIIETMNVELDEDYAAQHVAVEPGSFVLLSVTDTGAGIDEETRRHIFEPFFTTKEKGKGTGLGLATVYGIVAQSGGHLWVYSELGLGTVFKVYLPRVDAPATDIRRRPVSEMVTGKETVMIVEDEAAVCKLAERILRSAGYRVLSAPTGGDALILGRRHGAEIDLLLTDVVMPQMSGRELAERLAPVCPRIRVLYMSGYTDNTIVHHGVLDPGTRFIGKPFAAGELMRKVREVLDE